MKKSPLFVLACLAGFFSFGQSADTANTIPADTVVASLPPVPDTATLYFQKGLEYKSQGRNFQAALNFDSATKAKPKYLEAFIELGQVNLLMHRQPQAQAAFEAATNIAPDHPIAQTALMDLYYNSHQYNKAIAAAKACSDCSSSLRILGMSFYQNSDFSNAADRLLLYLDKNPQDETTCYTIADCYNQLGAFPNAKIWLENAIALNTTKLMWMYELGMICYNMNDYAGAAKWLKTAADNGIAMTPDFKESLALAYIYNGQLDEGEKIMLQDRNGAFNVAEFYYRRQNYDRALLFCQRLLDQNKNDAKTLYLAGLCFRKKGDERRGNYLCEQAIKLDPALGTNKH